MLALAGSVGALKCPTPALATFDSQYQESRLVPSAWVTTASLNEASTLPVRSTRPDSFIATGMLVSSVVVCPTVFAVMVLRYL